LGAVVLSAFSNQNISNQTAVGLDVSNGRFVHSFRYGYLDFNNYVVDVRNQIPGYP
jgi:hypothetical protein